MQVCCHRRYPCHSRERLPGEPSPRDRATRAAVKDSRVTWESSITLFAEAKSGPWTKLPGLLRSAESLQPQAEAGPVLMQLLPLPRRRWGELGPPQLPHGGGSVNSLSLPGCRTRGSVQQNVLRHLVSGTQAPGPKRLPRHLSSAVTGRLSHQLPREGSCSCDLCWFLHHSLWPSAQEVPSLLMLMQPQGLAPNSRKSEVGPPSLWLTDDG